MSSRGFTLIEVLVVLTIVGFVVSGVSLGLDAWRSRDAELAVQRLRLVLEASAERAEVRGQPIAMELLADGYRFSAVDPGGNWRPLEDPPLFVERLLPEDVRWAGLRTPGRTAGGRRLVFGSQPARFELTVATPRGPVVLVGSETGAVSAVPGG